MLNPLEGVSVCLETQPCVDSCEHKMVIMADMYQNLSEPISYERAPLIITGALIATWWIIASLLLDQTIADYRRHAGGLKFWL